MFGLSKLIVSEKIKRLKGKLKLLKWPLTLAEKDTRLIKCLPLKEQSKKYRHSLRLFRYWWASCAIREEIEKTNRIAVIADVGCERGLTKRIFRSDKTVKWIGFDWNISRPELQKAGYNELFKCNFDRQLPLADESTDIVVCLHVLEHLPRPDFTMREFQRVLRPGGLVLIGVPIKPKLIALLREKYFRHSFAKGNRKKGKHVNCFWPQRLCDLAYNYGFRTELISGGYFLRSKKNPLENFKWWIRLNHIFGIILPSLGSEVCYSARLISKASNVTVPGIKLYDGFWKLKFRTIAWTASLAACITAVFLINSGTGLKADNHECQATRLILSHQDGDDVFYVTRCTGIENGQNFENVNIIEDVSEKHLARINKLQQYGKDLHFLVPSDKIFAMMKRYAALQLTVATEITIRKKRYLLLTAEDYGRPVMPKS